MYSRKGDGRGDGYVIYRSNLPPRYAGSRFTSDESFAEKADIPPEASCDIHESDCMRDPQESKERDQRNPKKRRPMRLCGSCIAIRKNKKSERGANDICDPKKPKPPTFPFSRLGREELLLGIIILLLAKEDRTSENGELMLILALLLALK